MKKMIFFLCLFLFIGVIWLSNSALHASASEVDLTKTLKTNSVNLAVNYNTTYTEVTNYYSKSREWLNDKVKVGSDVVTISPFDVTGGTLYDSSQSFGYSAETVYLEPKTELTFTVDLTSGGLYQFYFDYYVLQETLLAPALSLQINDEIEYTEMNNIDIPVKWQIPSENSYDRYGDQLIPKSQLVSEWEQDQSVYDPNHFFSSPLSFELNKGINTITLTMNEGYMLIGQIQIKNHYETVPTYEEYLQNAGSDSNDFSNFIQIEAENMTYKSRQSIRSKYMRDPSVTPYGYKNRVLNVIDEYSFADAGDSLTYRFDVDQEGLYQIALKYLLNINDGMPSHRTILIDGKVPFQDFLEYDFSYQTKWKNEVLQDDVGTPFELYFSKGAHTITLTINNEGVRDVYHQLLDVLDQIQTIAIQVNKMTGGLSDKDRDWKITKYLPTLVDDLTSLSNQLQGTIDDLSAYTGNSHLPSINAIRVAKGLIDGFIKKPDDLPNYMTKFNDGDSSAFSRINQIMPSLIYNPLQLDKLFITHDHALPKANVNFFVKMTEGVKAFFYSFFDPKYNQSESVDDKTIEIWVNKSRIDTEIIQQMIDQEFTPVNGIKVQLSIMPDENKIILSQAAGTTPDGVLGLSTAKPFDLALRGVIEDLRGRKGFYDLASEFNPNTFIPFIYNDGVYAIPDSQDVKLMYYRKDLFNQLGITAPETWEDVITLLPILQKSNMNFYLPIGSNNAFKGFDVTTPFIYQYGGSLYDENTMTTTINKDGAFEAFELMTDFYTVYNLPLTTSNFFQSFRDGTIPVGIGDANMYIQLKYAAPELAGLWGVLPIPGIKDENGVIDRSDPTYSSASVIFKSSEKKDMTWDFIKWWESAETQSEFSYNLQSTLGDRYLYMSANLQGFLQGAWPSDSKQAVLDQWKWIQSTGKVPGDYMLERELSNAWNKVIYDSINPRIAIDQSLTSIDLEIERKLQEFGYMDENGNIIKEYRIPTINNVESWLTDDEVDN